MKLLYVTASFPFQHGEAFLVPEIKELRERGHTLWIVPRDGSGPVVHGDAEMLLSITKAQSLFSREVLRAALSQALRYPLRTLRAASLLLQSRNPWVFLKNLAVLPKGLWLAQMAREAGAEHIHAHWVLTTATMAMIASEISGIPWSYTAHRGDIVEQNLLSIKSERAAFCRFISKGGLDMAAGYGVPVQEAKFRVIHMGVPLPGMLREGKSSRESFLLICPANLLPVKGHRYLIEAMALLGQRGIDAMLWIAGQGELRAELEKQVEEAGLQERVRFLGQVSHATLLDWYARCEVDGVVLPSVDLGDHVHEGIPVSLIEAMSYGLPTISTDTGGIPELLYDEAGLIVPPQDPLALAAAIERVIREPELRRMLAQKGSMRVREEFAQERTIELLEACFEASSLPAATPHAIPFESGG